MLNYIWLGLILCAVVFGGLTNRMGDVAQQGIQGAREAVEIALKLIGVMALWLGLMRLAERAGLVQLLARGMRPVMRRLFPDVPPEHPAMGSMLMNMAANFLGIGNAATPLGLRAMRDLEKLNPRPGTATNAMCTFLAINTSSIQLIPANQIALLAAAGSVRPTAIIGTAIVATTISTIVGITSVKLLEKLRWFRLPPVIPMPTPVAPSDAAAPAEPLAAEEPVSTAPLPGTPWAGRLAILGLVILFAWFFVRMTFPTNVIAPGAVRVSICEHAGNGMMEGPVVAETATSITVAASVGTNVIAKQHPPYCPKAGEVTAQIRFAASQGPGSSMPLHADTLGRHTAAGVRAVDTISLLAIPFLVAFFPLYAALRRIKVYEEFVEGAKEGFGVAITIIPHVVAMLVVVFMFRAAGCIDAITTFVRPALEILQFPPELLPMSLMRPISGGASTAMFIELIKTYGPDHFFARTAGTIIGSTENTLYVLAVYFGSVGIRRVRHAVAAGLLADASGIIASVIICRLVFG